MVVREQTQNYKEYKTGLMGALAEALIVRVF